ncbi:hypothetical protein [Leptolyngbya sp. KIOST-1]|uniref:hypothetical protein n=1 Tax=Leptolyngbya sp. KIOST-1 TaxID=1229172 RepID=UPI0012E07283|nr:hypothetical protein [Leptolyngbya sp. KIOST-1]
MVLSAVRSLASWLPSDLAALPGATASTLSNMVCRMAPLAIERSALAPEPAVAVALEQLVKQSMALRSPTGGWPADLPQTPEHLGAYLSEETGEFLDALAATRPPSPPQAPSLIPISALVPQLLWMLASGSYEVMRLIEGVRARVAAPDQPEMALVVRLVPVLVLTIDTACYTLDLVTQTDPVPSLHLAETADLRLLENDLDSRSWRCGDLLDQVAQILSYTQPGLSPLLGEGCSVEALRPFQPWQPATLRLHLHLAQMGTQALASPSQNPGQATPSARYLPPDEKPRSRVEPTDFTLDDFASTLLEDPADATAGVLGNWLTFTDETWIQTFLTTCAQRVIGQNLARICSRIEPRDMAEPSGSGESLCNRVTYIASDLVQGANGLFKHTFVHEPILVADVWPRLRWYLAQSSERVMQLMGGVSAQVLPPGLSWQQGSLYLRPLMQLTTAQRSWIVDLSRGRLLPTSPVALPAAAAVDIAAAPWHTPLTVADLTALIDYDLGIQTPAIAALRQGTAIHLHRLDAEAGCQPAQLTLDWCFTLQTTL